MDADERMSTQGRPLEADLVSLRELVNARLADFVGPDSFTSSSDCPAKLRESMAYSLLAGGKRLRPVLVLLACEACGGQMEAALPAACAIEMVHTYSLIHDDLPAMDDDDFRRGRPTNHKVYGEAMAILAGDALLTLAFEVIATHTQPPASAAACCADLASAAGWCGMVAGQVADIQAEERGEERGTSGKGSESAAASGRPSTVGPQPSALSQLEAIHRRKTGRLLTSAVTLGARVAQADPNLIDRLEQFGKRVGLAFQIADDLLDVTGDAAKLGKGVGKDATLGKKTYPGLLGVEDSRRKAEALIDEACRLLEPLGERGHKLAALARFVTQRDH
jgi:geranylgeranyl diphosphate synthase, type II